MQIHQDQSFFFFFFVCLCVCVPTIKTGGFIAVESEHTLHAVGMRMHYNCIHTHTYARAHTHTQTL